MGGAGERMADGRGTAGAGVLVVRDSERNERGQIELRRRKKVKKRRARASPFVLLKPSPPHRRRSMLGLRTLLYASKSLPHPSPASFAAWRTRDRAPRARLGTLANFIVPLQVPRKRGRPRIHTPGWQVALKNRTACVSSSCSPPGMHSFDPALNVPCLTMLPYSTDRYRPPASLRGTSATPVPCRTPAYLSNFSPTLSPSLFNHNIYQQSHKYASCSTRRHEGEP